MACPWRKSWKHGPEWYAAQFAEARDDQVVGEASNAYTRHPIYAGAPERAAAAGQVSLLMVNTC